MDDKLRIYSVQKWLRLGIPLLSGFLLIVLAVWFMHDAPTSVYADPIDPPAGYPKLSLSVKTVTPTLAYKGGATLDYLIEIRNTGAYTAYQADGMTLSDTIPANTTYVGGSAVASSGPAPSVSGGLLTWAGDVGFDETVFISFTVNVDSAFSGLIQNTAVISHSLIADPVIVIAESMITDDPVLAIEKTSAPAIPGANKPMIYTLTVTNLGQPAVNLPITVKDKVPAGTTFRDADPDGTYKVGPKEVEWNRSITLDLGETTQFTFSVDIGNVPSGTIITNDTYQVASLPSGITTGDVYTVTVLDPIFSLSKETIPDPPGSNREATYLLTLLNTGSLATDITITDTVPAGSTYVDGGVKIGNVVSWTLPQLDTFESAQFTFTVYISDVAEIPLINNDFGVCSSEGSCQPGKVLTSTIGPPTFEAFAVLDPIAHKPGGGKGTEVTPTLSIHNIGPGSALNATAILYFEHLSVQASDIQIITATGTPVPTPLPDGPDCGNKCVSYLWTGDLAFGEWITFTTIGGQSTIVGSEGTLYTATIVITDSLSNVTTDPVMADAVGLITHRANLIPTKSAPPVIGPGQFMTYTIHVQNTGMSTDDPPSPWLTDTVPLSVTVVNISDFGVSMTVGSSVVVSWSLPAMSPGDELNRSFQVQVDGNLVSGTQIINDDYRTRWYVARYNEVLSKTGQAVTTTVREVGLIDSYKTVTPTLVRPGAGNVLTYYLHIVNSGAIPLTGVNVYDWLPWESTTYQRDAVATSGSVISDIVSVQWTGDVAAFSEEVITLTTLIDSDFQGAITNTAVISHPTLQEAVTVETVSYATDDPVLQISKSASPDPVNAGGILEYTIEVVNLGQDAHTLVVTDSIPVNTTYVAGSATAGGQVSAGIAQWEFSLLESGEKRTFTFRVTVSGSGSTVVNDQYGVRAAGGFMAMGAPVITDIGTRYIYLPMIVRN